jgi:hypothetical protein
MGELKQFTARAGGQSLILHSGSYPRENLNSMQGQKFSSEQYMKINRRYKRNEKSSLVPAKFTSRLDSQNHLRPLKNHIPSGKGTPLLQGVQITP